MFPLPHIARGALASEVRAKVAATPSLRVVSFDVFDTLLWRLGPPEAVVEAEVVAIARALDLPRETVRESRRSFAGVQNAWFRAGQESEWHVGQWLEQLARELALEVEPVLEAGLAAHLEIEKRATRPVQGAADLISELRAQGLQTVALSDTWTPPHELQVLLHVHGLELDAVVASNALHASKRRGTIFSQLYNRWNIKPCNLLHIGDNWKADLARPLQQRAHTLYVPRAGKPPFPDRLPQEFHPAYVEVSTALELEPSTGGPAPKELPPGEQAIRILEQIGEQHLAPLLAAFSLIADQHFAEHDTQAIFFLARDAHLMHTAWEQLVGSRGPRTHYLRLSRRAIALAHPAPLLESGVGLAGRFGHTSAAAFLGGFALPPALTESILLAAGLAAETPLDSQTTPRLQQAIAAHQSSIEALRQETRENLRDFFAPALGDASRIGLVDSGWAGTTQDVLAHVLEVESIRGMYLGISDAGRPSNDRSSKLGLLRDDARSQPWMNRLERSAGVIRLWDTLLREPVASVERLVRKGGKVEALRDPGSVPEPQQQRLSHAVREGVVRGLSRLRPGFDWLRPQVAQYQPALSAFACQHAHQLSIAPRPEVARALLQLRYEELDGSTWSLGLETLADRRAWLGGLLASSGLRPAAHALEWAARTLTKD